MRKWAILSVFVDLVQGITVLWKAVRVIKFDDTNYLIYFLSILVY